MLVYHGGGTIIKEPEIIKRKYATDFGTGFYCTLLKDQAYRWAMNNRRNNESGYISIYEIGDVSGLKVKVFDEVSDEWLDFIAFCRTGKEHEYDIVEGPMADDQIWLDVARYMSGEMPKEAFMALAKFKHPTHQISFHTKAALAKVDFKGSEKA
ncbi:MAG TPA: hypothetical protein DCP90_06515 [Clostridiales bacterium]|nr:MAG: hypothetical protein A2Y22_00760 [Clostridiales bacterium GWD2_32_59]HAN10246.1 hypothetical protein [Clostridiales bacterium]